MDRQPDDIRRYARLIEQSLDSNQADLLVEGRIVDQRIDLLIEDVSDMIFKLRSYSEPADSPDYARGVEEGLELAASMLERLVEMYASKTDLPEV